MNKLRLIKAEYNLENLQWVKEEEIFQSNVGKKRLRVWQDKQLLDWHIKWRDEVSKESGMMTDRMIHTKTGDPYIISEYGFLTIHDEVEGQYPCKGREAHWGELIAATLFYGCSINKSNVSSIPSNEPSLVSIKDRIRKLQLKDKMAKAVVEKSYFEAKKRVHKAEQITNEILKSRLPILNQFRSFEDGREVFFQLYYICGEEKPVRGYDPLRHLLESWLTKNGKNSLVLLLEEINKSFNLKGEQGMLLLAQCLQPYELKEAMEQLESSQEKEVSEIINRYLENWERSRNLVHILSQWLEETRRKEVAT